MKIVIAYFHSSTQEMMDNYLEIEKIVKGRFCFRWWFRVWSCRFAGDAEWVCLCLCCRFILEGSQGQTQGQGASRHCQNHTETGSQRPRKISSSWSWRCHGRTVWGGRIRLTSVNIWLSAVDSSDKDHWGAPADPFPLSKEGNVMLCTARGPFVLSSWCWFGLQMLC